MASPSLYGQYVTASERYERVTMVCPAGEQEAVVQRSLVAEGWVVLGVQPPLSSVERPRTAPYISASQRAACGQQFWEADPTRVQVVAQRPLRDEGSLPPQS